jgi:hypothetical protein
MKYIIDTCSWIALAKYYYAFDNKRELYHYFENKVLDKEYIILDKVYEECKRTSKGIAVTSFEFIEKNQTKTDEIIPTNKDFNKVKDQYCYKQMINKLGNDNSFNQLMEKFMESADYKIVLYVESLRIKNTLFGDATIVTEETPTQNDHKCFKKIPEICSIEKFPCINMPNLLISSKLNIDIYRQ